MPQLVDYRILGTLPEIEAFLTRIALFTDADGVLVTIETDVPLDRIGNHADLVEVAGTTGAADEIISELARQAFAAGKELPHIVLFPSGHMAVLRYLGGRDKDGEASVRIAICPGGPEDGEKLRDTLAQVLLGLQDSVGATPGKLPLPSRHDADWPAALAALFDRDSLESAYAQLLAKREDGQTPRVTRGRSDLIDAQLRWFGALSKPGSVNEQQRQQIPATGRASRASVDLKLHVINMRYGELSNRGQFQTSASDVQAIVDAAKAWIGKDKSKRLAIYAHGGLVGEEAALAYAGETAPWWLENGVYPVFCIWESDAVTTILQLIRETLGGGRRGSDWLGDIRDAAIERLIHSMGQPVWDMMKRSAMRGSADGLQHGLTLFARRLKAGFGKSVPPIDLVGHSAGSVLLLPFLSRLQAEGLKADSFQTLAPAATSQLYRDYLSAFGGTRMKTRIYAMQDATERLDSVAGMYGKSLLYLVSRGFEDHFGEQISGLQKDLLSDRQFIALLCRWSGGVTREAMVFSPTPEGTPRRLSSGAVTHGGFDNDPQTMWSVMHLIRGDADATRITPFPMLTSQQRSGGAGALRMDLPEEVRTYLNLAQSGMSPDVGTSSVNPTTTAATSTAPVSAPAPVSAMAYRGTRRALTIGIDEYASANRLAGCVNDSNIWREMLKSRGFAVTQLASPDKTGRDQIIGQLQDLVMQSGAGDTLVWHFSGHGMRIESIHGSDNDFETTGADQAIVASNGSTSLNGHIPHAIIDDDIHTILQGLNPQSACYVFLDSCFSGSGTRLTLPGTPRSVGTLYRTGYAARNHALTDPMTHAARGGPYDGANHVLFSAASAKQVALENGTPPLGVFTRAVRDLLGQQTTPLTNNAFSQRINELTVGMGQTAGVYCDMARLEQPFPLIGS